MWTVTSSANAKPGEAKTPFAPSRKVADIHHVPAMLFFVFSVLG
jgi:hypothetical protein